MKELHTASAKSAALKFLSGRVVLADSVEPYQMQPVGAAGVKAQESSRA